MLRDVLGFFLGVVAVSFTELRNLKHFDLLFLAEMFTLMLKFLLACFCDAVNVLSAIIITMHNNNNSPEEDLFR
jgi:hypothetical protein